MNHLQRLHIQFGQSPWLDNLSRDLITNGKLQGFIDQGIRGVTSNPTILEKAITSGAAYDSQIIELKAKGLTPLEVYRKLVEKDIKAAAQILRPVWERSEGKDGFVSLEVSPTETTSAETIVAEARRYWNEINEPNLMIKVPATDIGIPAIEQLLGEGINVNVTLIFSLEYYQKVVNAFKAAYRNNPEISSQSVASFFVSRIDSEVDGRLEAIGTEEALNLRGQAAVANAHRAYRIFLDEFYASASNQIQRVLWASTSTKNPSYDDLIYVRYLLASPTVNTMPEATIANVLDHFPPDARTITEQDIAHADNIIERITSAGVDMDDVFSTLEREGDEKFTASFNSLLATIESK